VVGQQAMESRIVVVRLLFSDSRRFLHTRLRAFCDPDRTAASAKSKNKIDGDVGNFEKVVDAESIKTTRK